MGVFARFVVVVALFAAAAPAQAQAGVWFTTPEVLKSFFAHSDRVAYVDIDAAALKARGISSTKAKHHVYVGYTGSVVDGFAVIDDEVGQHEPISFAVQLTPTSTVARVEVMAYREAYGAEIRSARYRDQWIGKSLADFKGSGANVDANVDAISGATLSSRSTAAVVKRALTLATLAQETLAKAPTMAPNPTTTPNPPAAP